MCIILPVVLPQAPCVLTSPIFKVGGSRRKLRISKMITEGLLFVCKGVGLCLTEYVPFQRFWTYEGQEKIKLSVCTERSLNLNWKKRKKLMAKAVRL